MLYEEMRLLLMENFLSDKVSLYSHFCMRFYQPLHWWLMFLDPLQSSNPSRYSKLQSVKFRSLPSIKHFWRLPCARSSCLELQKESIWILHLHASQTTAVHPKPQHGSQTLLWLLLIGGPQTFAGYSKFILLLNITAPYS